MVPPVSAMTHALRFLAPDRREFLRLGGLAGLSFALPKLQAAPTPGQAKSVLFLYASGGQSQLELWDPKPEAPVEIRGAFGTIPTAVPGLRIGEHLPRTAGVLDRCTVVRCLSHDDLDHGSASYLTLTGQPHPIKSSNPPPSPNDLPCLGAVLKRVRPAAHFPHTAVHLNGPLLVPKDLAPGQNGGFLGRGYDPLLLGNVTTDPLLGDGLEPRADLPPLRLGGRKALLHDLENHVRGLEGNSARLDRDRLYRQAYELLSAPHLRQAFDLGREPAALRERYGLDRTGQACLLGRRLVEAGVPLVTVFLTHSIRGQDFAPNDTDSYGWDTHNDIFTALKERLLPRFDQAFSALIEDLDQRGLLASTLVICLGEFGRAPRVALERSFVGTSPGRKHWAAVYSGVFAGSGVSRGAVFGASDRHAGQPATTPIGPWDVAATIYSALGIDPSRHYTDAAGRPIPLATGRPVRGIYE